MDVSEKLDEIRKNVENARSMPVSASCVLNRTELLAELAELADLLPIELAESRRVLADRQAVVDDGRAEADRLLAEARQQRDAMVRDTDVYRQAQYAAQELHNQAEADAAALRRETDDYVDQKLASFEIALNKTLATVARGRDRLRGRAAPPVDESDEALVLRREVDEYVEHKLTRFEHTLHKTLDAVSRGRERLRDRSGLDAYTPDSGGDVIPLPGEYSA